MRIIFFGVIFMEDTFLWIFFLNTFFNDTFLCEIFFASQFLKSICHWCFRFQNHPSDLKFWPENCPKNDPLPRASEKPATLQITEQKLADIANSPVHHPAWNSFFAVGKYRFPLVHVQESASGMRFMLQKVSDILSYYGENEETDATSAKNKLLSTECYASASDYDGSPNSDDMY